MLKSLLKIVYYKKIVGLSFYIGLYTEGVPMSEESLLIFKESQRLVISNKTFLIALD